MKTLFGTVVPGTAGGQYTALIVSKMVESINEADVGIEATQIWRLKVSGQGSANNKTFFIHESQPKFPEHWRECEPPGEPVQREVNEGKAAAGR